MNEMNSHHRDLLLHVARRVMKERSLLPEFSREILSELEGLNAAPLNDGSQRKDLRHLLWSSIDNDDSRDLDQLTVAEPLSDGSVKMLVAVADVDSLVKKGDAVDDHARHNTTSVYTAGQVFSMLPEKLSYDLTSLNENEDRPAMIIEMVFDAGGRLQASDIYQALVRNQAQLAYNSIAAWLEEGAPEPEPVSAIEGLKENLRLQDRMAQKLKTIRHELGALELQTIQTHAVFDGDAMVALEIDQKNRARELIENLMIAANGVTAGFLNRKKLPSLRRVVRTPRRWDRIVTLAMDLGFQLPQNPSSKALSAFLKNQEEKDPLRFPDVSLTVVKLIGSGEYRVAMPGESVEGHFGLAVKNYTHSTAPNRRFPDLITQRLLKAALSDAPSPYNEEELNQLAAHCTQKEDDADKVERQVAKSAAAILLEDRIGERFSAIVTGASEKGTWVRIFDPPIEGMLVEGFDGLDVGDSIQVKLVDTNVDNGYIDFSKMSF
ncbi:MAG: RNB domain-containing ribonuclease [Candidatus Eisenbacteria bacterium]|uniref:RNB domain-containing ribonuclease n=1 Tax=Eiseniibacteriota bacterium TaxID=2212470 RepID=A0A948RUJ8_UNCEI|nr:RNB domain-containing ribonuclease [Candidatus Eisenbacteria bacterium]MBU1948856.1 RNB domain-containing ribonuclease [Candidatus Eisenbacteria bacterium]MBU2691278.1 RNB domain-containing ribonuclease [Candidatus Eisenbacteria bacterium]